MCSHFTLPGAAFPAFLIRVTLALGLISCLWLIPELRLEDGMVLKKLGASCWAVDHKEESKL